MNSTVELEKCSKTELSEHMLGEHPKELPGNPWPVVLPSATDLDAYVAMIAEEENIRVLTSK